MEQEKTVTNMAIRSAYDTLVEIVGENAGHIIFRNVGLARVIESPPDYTWDKQFTNAEQIGIYRETIDLIGPVGGQGILRFIGYKAVEIPVLKFGILEHLKDLSKEERLLKCFQLLQVAINKGRVIENHNGFPAYDVFDCLICEGVTSPKPFCANYAGSIQFVTDWVYGKGAYLARETKCRAKGDDRCFIEIEAKG
jgi:predicted hydrocarbon binding protein